MQTKMLINGQLLDPATGIKHVLAEILSLRLIALPDSGTSRIRSPRWRGI